MKIRLLTVIAAAALFIMPALADRDKLNVDYNQIEVDMTINPQIYRELNQRFVEGDSTLTPSELATVYYGYSFTFDYNPKADYSDIVADFEAEDYASALTKIRAALPYDPVSLDLLAMGVISAARGHNVETLHEMRKYQTRFDQIVNTILTSGKGISPNDAFVVIREADIDSFLSNVLGVKDIVGRAMIGPIDAVKLRFPGSTREHILYFDNTRQKKLEGWAPF